MDDNYVTRLGIKVQIWLKYCRFVCKENTKYII